MQKTERLEYDLGQGRLSYQPGKRGIHITEYHGLANEVQVPEQIENTPVTVVEKKAFLSKKNLRRVILPVTVEEVGDWAFAYCDHLTEVAFAGEEVHLGRSVFLECGQLEFLRIAGKDDATAALLAAAVTTAQAPYLLDLSEAGGSAWLAKWDARMLAILHSDDMEGYSRQVLCGEEDYGSTDPGAYTGGRRRIKVRLALLRLLYDRDLSESVRTELTEYLVSHRKGCESEETWQVVLEEHGDDRAYYQLLTDLGCVTPENFAGMLNDMGEEHPEMKAFLLRFQANELQQDDFFDSLDL